MSAIEIPVLPLSESFVSAMPAINREFVDGANPAFRVACRRVGGLLADFVEDRLVAPDGPADLERCAESEVQKGMAKSSWPSATSRYSEGRIVKHGSAT